MIKENKNKIFIILAVLLLLISWFYWFEWRPARTKSYCNWVVRSKEDGPKCKNDKCYDLFYKVCLHEKGL